MAQIEKTPFVLGLWFRVRAKIDKNIHFGEALARISAKIEKNTLCGRALVRVRAINREKIPFFVGL